MMIAPADAALLDAIRALRWPARKGAPAGLVGEHLSRVLGGTAEFTEYRVYRQGDDPGRIDWKLVARSDRVFIRLSRERTMLPTTLVVDASASLAYPESTLEKWQYARLVAIGLASAAHRGGDPVGLIVGTAEGPKRLPLRTRQGVVHDIARVLRLVVPAGNSPLAPVLLTHLARGRVAIVSDFLGDDADDLLAASARLCVAGREVHAIHIVHPAELDPPRRTALAMDPEHTELRRPLTEGSRRHYAGAFGAWRAALASAWRGAGATYAEVVTREPVAHAVRRIVTPAVSASAR